MDNNLGLNMYYGDSNQYQCVFQCELKKFKSTCISISIECIQYGFQYDLKLFNININIFLGIGLM
ncbi:unnamed protein product, partial [Adineta steineri]